MELMDLLVTLLIIIFIITILILTISYSSYKFRKKVEVQIKKNFNSIPVAKKTIPITIISKPKTKRKNYIIVDPSTKFKTYDDKLKKIS